VDGGTVFKKSVGCIKIKELRDLRKFCIRLYAKRSVILENWKRAGVASVFVFINTSLGE
jgi:hypothetical protein